MLHDNMTSYFGVNNQFALSKLRNWTYISCDLILDINFSKYLSIKFNTKTIGAGYFRIKDKKYFYCILFN